MEVDTKTIEMTFTFNGETKVSQFELPLEDHWNSLEKQFREQFNINEDEPGLLKAKYVDEEGDLITLDSDEELRDLLAGLCLKDRPIQLEFSFSKGRKAPQRREGRRGCLISREERNRLRSERMLRKFGKILTKEDRLQMREERKKLRAERMLQTTRRRCHQLARRSYSSVSRWQQHDVRHSHSS